MWSTSWTCARLSAPFSRCASSARSVGRAATSRSRRTQSRSRSEFIFDKELIDELVIDKDLIDELVIDKELIDELIVDWTSTRTNKGASSARSSYVPWHRGGVAHVALARI